MKWYYTPALVCLLGISAVVFACKSDEVDPLVPPGHAAIGLNKSARVASDLVIRVDSLRDGRCPEGHQCIIAGWATASMTVSTEAESRKIELSTEIRLSAGGYPKDRRDSTTLKFLSDTYSIVLRDVIPYPVRNERPPQQAVIQIRRL